MLCRQRRCGDVADNWILWDVTGIMILEGQGIQRLGDKWYPVQAGDAVWMAPMVPQWYAALGTRRTRYILYKDTARDPLFFPHTT
jgi:glyoxylate utilization-related uncharacterized protein